MKTEDTEVLGRGELNQARSKPYTIVICEVCSLEPPLLSLGHIWDVMLVWRKENIEKNCLCVTVLCTIIMVHKDTSSSSGRSTVSGFDLAWFSSLSSEHLSVSLVFMVLYIKMFFFICLHPSLYLSVSWAWWDWPLTWLTNHRPSVLWHCWLGHLACKIVFEMICDVWSGTLDPTILYHTCPVEWLWQ